MIYELSKNFTAKHPIARFNIRYDDNDTRVPLYIALFELITGKPYDAKTCRIDHQYINVGHNIISSWTDEAHYDHKLEMAEIQALRNQNISTPGFWLKKQCVEIKTGAFAIFENDSWHTIDMDKITPPKHPDIKIATPKAPVNSKITKASYIVSECSDDDGDSVFNELIVSIQIKGNYRFGQHKSEELMLEAVRKLFPEGYIRFEKNEE